MAAKDNESNPFLHTKPTTSETPQPAPPGSEDHAEHLHADDNDGQLSLKKQAEETVTGTQSEAIQLYQKLLNYKHTNEETLDVISDNASAKENVLTILRGLDQKLADTALLLPNWHPGWQPPPTH